MPASRWRGCWFCSCPAGPPGNSRGGRRAIRDLARGLGIDAYHHTAIAQLFVQNGGIPDNYEPFAPLTSFTYHFGFHAWTAALAWLHGPASLDMARLMPLAGQAVGV